MLVGALFIAVVLGSAVRRKDMVKAGTWIYFVRTGVCFVQSAIHVYSKIIEYNVTHFNITNSPTCKYPVVA